MTVRAPIKRIGRSSAIILPKPALAALDVRAGRALFVSIEDARVVLSSSKAHPRAGWAVAARKLALAGDDAPVWSTPEEW
jgi:antitoxin MazE